MDAYATHLEALVMAIASTTGPILEMGCGDYSTPLLAAAARAQGRRFLVQSSDPEWSGRFHDLANVELVDWAAWQPQGAWGLVLLDNEESTAGRLDRLGQLRGHAGMVVMHDADGAMTRPSWGQRTGEWGSMRLFSRYRPWTAVLMR